MTISITGKKAALVNSDGIVENIIVWQEGDSIPTDHTIVVLDAEHHISIGWIHNNDGTFTDPNPPAEPTPAPQPTLAELQSQLAALTAQIQTLANT